MLFRYVFEVSYDMNCLMKDFLAVRLVLILSVCNWFFIYSINELILVNKQDARLPTKMTCK